MPSIGTILSLLSLLVLASSYWLVFHSSRVHLGEWDNIKCLVVPSEPAKEISLFLDFVADISNFHPSDPLLFTQIQSLQEIYHTSLTLRCNITTTIFSDVLINSHKNFSSSKDNLQQTLSCIKSGWIADTFNISNKLQNATSFVSSVCHSVGLARKHNVESFSHRPIVLVVGAGPMGLGNAIETFASGADVQVYEKRGNYTRSLWLDLMSKPWSSVHEVLMKWGWGWQNVEAKIYSNPAVWTVRIQTIERFLAKVASMVGVTLNYQREFLAICDPSHAAIRPPNHSLEGNPCDDNTISVHFDVLIGSDGTSSGVRKSAQIDFPNQETFLLQRDNKTFPGIKQVTMIANFDPWISNNGKCPELETDKTGTILSPWYPSFRIAGVNSVWKRFYFGHCQLQVLFHNSLGEKIWEQYSENKPKSTDDLLDWEEAAISWDYLLQIVNSLVKHKYTNTAQLQRDLLRKANGEYDIQVFPVAIRKAAPLTKVLRGERVGDESGRSHAVRSVVVLVGDAAVTAHYRLGVGINNAFSSFNEVGEMIQKIGSMPNECWASSIPEKCNELLSKIALEREAQAQLRVKRLVDFQLAAMYYESYCDFVVSYNTEKDMAEALEIFRRDNKNERFDEVLDTELLHNCHSTQ